VSDTLNRTYSLVDELVFQEAKKDPNAKEVYKTLVGLHDVCVDYCICVVNRIIVEFHKAY
jgi:hypothetical protein